MDKYQLVYAPKAQADLLELPQSIANQILDDIEILLQPPWPAGRVKKIKGQKFWEIRSGDYRTLFIPEGDKMVILRVVNRKDLERAIKRIDVRTIVCWLHENKFP